jgi:hypothetical protein
MATVVRLSFSLGTGFLRLDDGREMSFDVDACGHRPDAIPQVGDRVAVTTAPARDGHGERVVQVDPVVVDDRATGS